VTTVPAHLVGELAAELAGGYVEDGPVEPGLGRVAVLEVVTGVLGISLGLGGAGATAHAILVGLG
jgi:hypothetical protein